MLSLPPRTRFVQCSSLTALRNLLRKIPVTCCYPAFQNRSPLIVLGYFLDAIILATYIPEYEVCIAAIPAATPLFFVPFALILLGLFHYRKKLLPMDKELIFEEPQTHWD